MRRLRIVFLGSPGFAVPTLEALLARHDVRGVVTQPDRPAGRGRHLAPPPVKVVAERAGVPVIQPAKVKRPEFRDAIAAWEPEVIAVAAYGRILQPPVLAAAPLGCLNVHASLLPRYRGAAPINWAIIRGETETGISIMRMDEGLDTGDVLLRRAEAIREDDTASSLGERLAGLGAELLLEALDGWAAGTLPARPQDPALATLAPPLRKEDGTIDFARPAREVRDHARGVDPWPGAVTSLGGEPLRLFAPRLAEGAAGAAPGTVLGEAGGLVVACAAGAVAFAELQLPGRRRLAARAFLAGHPVPPGTVLGR